MNRPANVGDMLTDALGSLVVINLASRHDRRAEFGEQLSQIGLSFTAPSVRIFTAIRPDDAGGFPTLGTRGCFLSHLGVLRDALNSGADSVLLCEDDLNFSASLTERSAYLCEQLQALPWDIFYGGFASPPPGTPIDPRGELLEVPADHGILCAHFVAFRRSALTDLVPYLEAILMREAGDPAGGPMHVDGAYAWFRRSHPGLRTLASVPPLGYQRASMTNIHKLNWRDRTPVIRQIMGLARRLRNKLPPTQR